MNLRKITNWHKTLSGFLVFGLVELALAVLFGTLAIDSGSLWQWTLTFVLFVGGISNLAQCLWKARKIKG